MTSPPTDETMKQEVGRFWEAAPCGTRDIGHAEGSREFFDQLERERDEKEPFIRDFARFDARRGLKMLEVGVGASTDFIRFARAGAELSGLDYTEHAVKLAKRRLELEGLAADVRQGDAENLPFADATFDFAYSWGVIHHTADTPRAAREIVRVLKPGGEACVMIYHRHSLVGLQAWIINALLKGRPTRTFTDVIASHIESTGTKAYTLGEARRLFEGLEDVKVTPIVTPYDVRYTRSKFLPKAIQERLPKRLGWFLVVEGRKPR